MTEQGKMVEYYMTPRAASDIRAILIMNNGTASDIYLSVDAYKRGQELHQLIQSTFTLASTVLNETRRKQYHCVVRNDIVFQKQPVNIGFQQHPELFGRFYEGKFENINDITGNVIIISNGNVSLPAQVTSKNWFEEL